MAKTQKITRDRRVLVEDVIVERVMIGHYESWRALDSKGLRARRRRGGKHG